MNMQQAKRRARELLAAEVRGLEDTGAGYLADEPPEVIRVWRDVVYAAADKICPRHPR